MCILKRYGLKDKLDIWNLASNMQQKSSAQSAIKHSRVPLTTAYMLFPEKEEKKCQAS